MLLFVDKMGLKILVRQCVIFLPLEEGRFIFHLDLVAGLLLVTQGRSGRRIRRRWSPGQCPASLSPAPKDTERRSL